MKNIILLMLFALLPFSASAQKKELLDAKTNIKKGTNLDKTEAAMRNLLKDSANVRNEKIWLTLFEAVKKQYEQNNEKLYLKQQSDTAQLFAHTRQMFEVLESFDSVDVAINNGKPAYRKKHSAYLNQIRKNLFNGGVYFLRKRDYAESYRYLDKYIDCAVQPLFSDYNYSEKDSVSISRAACWTSFCGYKLGKADLIDRYAALAVRDTTREIFTLQYIAESFLLKNDIEGYRSVLEHALEKHPAHRYFFTHLSVFYAQHNMFQEIIAISKRALAADEDNREALLAYSSALYDSGQYDDCIQMSAHLLELDENDLGGNLNTALSYYDKAMPLFNISVPKAAEREELRTLFSEALPFFERYRELAPDDTDSYALPLYNIYLTLNMGEGFEEMEKILYGD